MQPHEAPLDDEWYSRLSELQVVRLEPSNYKQAKRAFYSELTSEPAFSYDHIRGYKPPWEALRVLEYDIANSSSAPAVKRLYAKKLEELARKFEIFEETVAEIGAGSASEGRPVQALVESVYGKPSQEVFNHLLRKLSERYLSLTFPVIRSGHYAHLAQLFHDVEQ